MVIFGRCAVLVAGSFFLGVEVTTPVPPQPVSPAVLKPAQPPAPPPFIPKQPPILIQPSDPKPPPAEKEPRKLSAPLTDEQLLKNAGIKSDGPDLIEFLRQRTLTDDARPNVQKLIRQLGSVSYHEREKAMHDLIVRGPAIAQMLRQAAQDSDSEISRRSEKCLARITEKEVAVEVPSAVVRLLAVRKPPGAIETLLSYVLATDQDSVREEIRGTLAKLAVADGKTNPLLVEALRDQVPLRRAIAGEALCLARAADARAAVHKLLDDADPLVRFRVALVLVEAREASAVPVLIDAVPHLPYAQAWQAADLLYRLAEGKNPPLAALGTDAAALKKFRDVWQPWWQKEGKNIDLAKLGKPAPLLGHTVVILLDENKVLELGADNAPRWQINNVSFPLDVQPLADDRVLLAEYFAKKVTERNLKGEILWEHPAVSSTAGGPLVAQRLPNGNTFIATDTDLIEVDHDKKEVMKIHMAGAERIMKAQKLPNGDIACLTSEARVVRFAPDGKELHAFSVDIAARLFGGRLHMQVSGHVLVPHNAEDKVVEYDAQGKAVWQVSTERPIAALRLPNGNTLVTSMMPARGAVEFTRAGTEVWTYHVLTRVTRAVRR